MIFKFIGGLESDMNSDSGLWMSSNTSAENVAEVLTLTKDAVHQHYKNRILPNWSAFQPSQVRHPASVLWTEAALTKFSRGRRRGV